MGEKIESFEFPEFVELRLRIQRAGIDIVKVFEISQELFRRPPFLLFHRHHLFGKEREKIVHNVSPSGL